MMFFQYGVYFFNVSHCLLVDYLKDTAKEGLCDSNDLYTTFI